MGFSVILGIAVGLAMDAFAVAIATSISLKNVSSRQLFRLSWHFGLFQAFMPVLGWSLGIIVADEISRWDHWVAFLLLTCTGGKAIWNAYEDESEDIEGNEEVLSPDPTRGWSLIMLSVATSIDALAVGISFAMLDVYIWYASAVIGVVAALFTLAGMLLGSRLGARFGERMEILGGRVLIVIGFRIVIKHTTGI